MLSSKARPGTQHARADASQALAGMATGTVRLAVIYPR